MKNTNSIRIGDVDVGPGERAIVDLPVADLYTHTQLTMPVHVINGRRSGPTLFVTGAIHGDELNGVEIIKRVQIGGAYLTTIVQGDVGSVRAAVEAGANALVAGSGVFGSSGSSASGMSFHRNFWKVRMSSS